MWLVPGADNGVMLGLDERGPGTPALGAREGSVSRGSIKNLVNDLIHENLRFSCSDMSEILRNELRGHLVLRQALACFGNPSALRPRN